MFLRTADHLRPQPEERPYSAVRIFPIDLRHGAVYLCDIAYKLQTLLKKIAAWAQRWDGIVAALQRDRNLPPSCRIHVWLFVPRDTIEQLDAKLEDLRRTSGCPFK